MKNDSQKCALQEGGGEWRSLGVKWVVWRENEERDLTLTPTVTVGFLVNENDFFALPHRKVRVCVSAERSVQKGNII